MGNVAQADYAAANGFMDRFAAYRDARCGRAKVDPTCLERLYKERITALVRAVRGPEAKGSFITGSYDYRQKGEAGEMFLAEMPDGSTLVLIETVNVGHRSPHTCTYLERVKDRRADVLSIKDAQASKKCGLEIAVTGNRAVLRETPKDCFEVAQYHCGAHGYMLGTYVKR